MRTRHEQVQAYRFVTRRISSAMLSGEPETTELPLRRLALSLLGSVIVAAIVLAVVGIYGFLNPAGGRPGENDIVIMRETGARFVFLDGRLHPVPNHTSARLVAGVAEPRVRSMSHRSLQGVPRGRPVGIRDAPDPPPDRRALLGPPWSVCSARPANPGGPVPTHVVVGRTPAGGRPLSGRAVLVTAGGDSPIYLLWEDRRLRVTTRTVLTALDLAATTPVRVGAPLLNSITAGPDLAKPKLAREGQPSPQKVAGVTGRIGQVYRSGGQDYVLTEAGLAPIGRVSAALLLADAAAVEITAAQAAQALARVQVEPDGFPRTRPELLTPDRPTLCAVYRGPAGDPGRPGTAVEVFEAGSEQLDGGAEGAPAQDGAATADRVLVPGGRGALVRSLPAPGATAATTVYLVTDQGLRYPLRDSADVEAQAALGYGGIEPAAVPATLLALVPGGPVLDPAAARLFLPAPASPTGPRPSSRPPSPSPSQSRRAGPGRRRRPGSDGVDPGGGHPLP
jgi:type VII secretion protein EccB